MATEEIQISELELADEVLSDMVFAVDTATDTKAVTLKQLRAWLGSSLPTGFIIPAVGKINDARFTLLDGKTLSKSGTYEAFCNKVVEQVQAGNWFTCSEEEYNADIATYGQCGKFVVTNDYVRIPKITRFIGATITLSEIGKSYAESLPNITGSVDTGTRKTDAVSEKASGSLYISEYGGKQGVYSSGGNAYNYQLVSIDASRSSETYKEGAKVQPDHTKFPYYMVVSTEGQTANVEIDINKVYEDIELKANSNLSNLSSDGKRKISELGIASKEYLDLSLGATGNTYTAPANGWFLICGKDTLGTKKDYGFVMRRSDKFGVESRLNSIGNSTGWCTGVLKVKKNDVVFVYHNMDSVDTVFRFFYNEGDI